MLDPQLTSSVSPLCQDFVDNLHGGAGVGGVDLDAPLICVALRNRRSADCQNPSLAQTCGLQAEVQMDPFEIKTLRIDRRSGRFREVDLLEE